MEIKKIKHYDHLIEISTWVVIILVIFGIRFLPVKDIDSALTYYLIGGIVAFALVYYLLVYKYFSKTNRFYLKSIADIVLIGVLIHLLKDYGQYFFALYFLPIAAAALSLEFISALLIATIASLFVVFEVFLNSFDLLPETADLYQGVGQIALILLITIFCRFLAIQVKQERFLKEEALAKQRALEEETKKEKEFMSLTSHQLYTPLSIIRGFSSMLKDDKFGKLDAKQEDAVLEVYNSSIRMTNLVSELLSITRIQSGKAPLCLKSTDFGKLIKNIVSEMDSINTKKIKISLDIEDNVQPINIDEDKIRQVIYNLLDNALKYTTEGEIKIKISQESSITTFSIEDNGKGIAKEDFEKIFQPFFRGKNILELDNQGTGLGLYISKLIIESHGGEISVESEAGNGSKFIIKLPNKIKNEKFETKGEK